MNAMANGCAPWSADQPPKVMIAISPALASSSITTAAFVALDSAFSRLGWRIAAYVAPPMCGNVPAGRAGCGRSGDLGDRPALHVVDEAPDDRVRRDQRGLAQELDVVADGSLEIRERPEVDAGGIAAGGVGHLLGDLVVRVLAHAAIGVADDRDLVGAEQMLRHGERAQRLARVAAGVADHVGVALVEPEEARRDEPRVHAGHDGHAAPGRAREVAVGKATGVGLVGGKELVDRAHGHLPCQSLYCDASCSSSDATSARLCAAACDCCTPATNSLVAWLVSCMPEA